MQSNNPARFTSPAHDWFMTNLDEIRSRVAACLCRLRPNRREEAVAEVIAAVFCAAVRANRRGTLHRVTPYYAVVFATRQFRQGRRVAGSSSTDVSSDATAVKRRVRVISLEAPDPQEDVKVKLTLSETLADRRGRDMPFEKARQNLDYPFILKAEKVGPQGRKLFWLLSAVRGPGQRVREPNRQGHEGLAGKDFANEDYAGAGLGQPRLRADRKGDDTYGGHG